MSSKIFKIITLPARLFMMGYVMLWKFIEGLPRIAKGMVINAKMTSANKQKFIITLVVTTALVLLESIIIPASLATILWYVPMRSAAYMNSFMGLFLFSLLISPWFWTFSYATTYMNKWQIWRAKKINAYVLRKNQH